MVLLESDPPGIRTGMDNSGCNSLAAKLGILAVDVDDTGLFVINSDVPLGG